MNRFLEVHGLSVAHVKYQFERVCDNMEQFDEEVIKPLRIAFISAFLESCVAKDKDSSISPPRCSIVGKQPQDADDATTTTAALLEASAATADDVKYGYSYHCGDCDEHTTFSRQNVPDLFQDVCLSSECIYEALKRYARIDEDD